MTIAAAHLNAAPAEPLRVGDVLPPLRGAFLTGKDVVLPSASAGKTALLILGFTYASRRAVEPWGDWFKKTLAARQELTFFEMPMIGGMGKLGRWFIDRGMRKNTPQVLHEHVITVYETPATGSAGSASRARAKTMRFWWWLMATVSCAGCITARSTSKPRGRSKG